MSGDRLRLDLNDREFQRQLLDLGKQDQRAVLITLRKLLQMSWEQVYRDSGLRWEAVVSRPGPHGGRLYSMRLAKGFRALAYRDGAWLRLLSLHPDHDSAYRK